MMIHPNFFVVGAMKSGTTSLHTYLASHPSIFMSRYKEPTHFVDGRELQTVSPLAYEKGYWKDRGRYLELFAQAGEASIVGESSTNYTKLPRTTGVAQRIAAFNHKARIAYVMRDPIERTISHYWHYVKNRGETREILKAIQQEPHYSEVSHYAMQIAPFLASFGSEHVKAFTLESMKADPVGVLQELFRWLGVDAAYVPPSLERHHVTTRVVTAQRFPILWKIRRSRQWDRVGPLIPNAIRTRLSRLAEDKRDRSAVDTGPVKDYLRPRQQEETRELSELLGREFPEWTTLYATAGPSQA